MNGKFLLKYQEIFPTPFTLEKHPGITFIFSKDQLKDLQFKPTLNIKDIEKVRGLCLVWWHGRQALKSKAGEIVQFCLVQYPVPEPKLFRRVLTPLSNDQHSFSLTGILIFVFLKQPNTRTVETLDISARICIRSSCKSLCW